MSGSLKDDIVAQEGISDISSQNEELEIKETFNRPSSYVYTPLLTGSRILSSSANACTSKSANVGPKRKSTMSTVPHNRGQKSSVRPFFCCGSELSLVSLVDTLELKDEGAKGLSKLNSIECSGSSTEEEESTSSTTCSQTVKISTAPLTRSTVRRKKKDKHSVKKKFWSLRLRGKWNTQWRVSQPQRSRGHRIDMPHFSPAGLSEGTFRGIGSPGTARAPRPHAAATISVLNLPQVYSIENLSTSEEVDGMRGRAGVEQLPQGVEINENFFNQALRSNLDLSNSMLDMLGQRRQIEFRSSDSNRSSPGLLTEEDYSLFMNNFMLQMQGSRSGFADGSKHGPLRVYTQVDYMHCLVPQLAKITSCPFYWGIMDRYEAERLLDNKPEGTFLLRDSAQEDFLFSVSFRRYSRSLHARVEQLNHHFSFDAHDPCVFSAPSVCDLMEHYKDPSSCMFFEPMLTRPLPRNFTFTLQHICRAVICDTLFYDQIHDLPIPNSLKAFLQTYHYKEKVRVRHFDGAGVIYTDNKV